MPNWTDDEGRNHFGKIDCKRCNQEFNHNEVGEVPVHECIGGYYTSGFDGVQHHAPLKAAKIMINTLVKEDKARKASVKRTLDELKEVITKERKCKHIPLSGLELYEVRHQFDVWLVKFASEIALSESKSK
jgi:hypothetical protein